MKKNSIILVICAVLCFSGCVNNNNGKCDKCGNGFPNTIVFNYDENGQYVEDGEGHEYCIECADEELGTHMGMPPLN